MYEVLIKGLGRDTLVTVLVEHEKFQPKKFKPKKIRT